MSNKKTEDEIEYKIKNKFIDEFINNQIEQNISWNGEDINKNSTIKNKYEGWRVKINSINIKKPSKGAELQHFILLNELNSEHNLQVKENLLFKNNFNKIKSRITHSGKELQVYYNKEKNLLIIFDGIKYDIY